MAQAHTWTLFAGVGEGSSHYMKPVFTHKDKQAVRRRMRRLQGYHGRHGYQIARTRDPDNRLFAFSCKHSLYPGNDPENGPAMRCALLHNHAGQCIHPEETRAFDFYEYEYE